MLIIGISFDRLDDGTINTRDLLEESTGREVAANNENEKTNTANAIREQVIDLVSHCLRTVSFVLLHS